MLYEDHQAVSVDSLLETESTASEQRLELVLGNAIKQRDFLGDLMDGSFERWEFLGVQVDSRLEIQTNDSDAIAELLDVFSGAGDTIVVVKIRQSAEHASSCSTAECHDQSLLLGIFDIEDLNDWARS